MPDKNTDSALHPFRLTNKSLDVILRALQRAADARDDYENESVARFLCEGSSRLVPEWARWTPEEDVYWEGRDPMGHDRSEWDNV